LEASTPPHFVSWGIVAIHVYAGPTLAVAEIIALASEAVVHGPVKHGDLLCEDFGPADRVVLIDGFYHQAGAVRHKEILLVMASGAEVIGAASMGAIRAAELWSLGMTGIGEVFRQYRDGELTADDEVAVAHGDGPEFLRTGEALVTIRQTLNRARLTGLVTGGEASSLLEHAQALPYPERSWAAIEHRAARLTPEVMLAAAKARGYAQANSKALDLKSRDARAAIRYAVSGRRPAVADLPSLCERAAWRTEYLPDWQARFHGQTVGGEFVSDLQVARHTQLHDAGFPARWRQYVLTVIAGFGQGDPAGGALRAAAARGLDAESLTADQAAWWVTPEEMRTLEPDELLLIILVRSYRPSRGDMDIVAATGASDSALAIRAAIAEHHAVNTAVGAKSPHWQLPHLNRGALATGLTALWEASEMTDAGRDAVARDRGFASFDAAVEAFRPFFLRAHLIETRRATSAKATA
jgi:hypothetical protein